MNTQLNTRRCSFCRNPGHMINHCLDPRIEETWKYVLRETDLRLGDEMREEDLNDVDTLLRQLPLPFLRALGVTVGGISVRSSIEQHIRVVKEQIYSEAEYFVCLRLDERTEYLKWLDPDSYDFEEEEEQDEIDAEIEGQIIDLNAAFIGEDPNDITHFAFIDRTPMVLEDEDEYYSEDDDESIIIEPMMLCLETETDLSLLKECIVCLDEKTAIQFDTTNCGHSFCHDCICHHLNTSKNGPTCPNCRTTISTLEVKDVDNYEDIVLRYGRRDTFKNSFFQY